MNLRFNRHVSFSTAACVVSRPIVCCLAVLSRKIACVVDVAQVLRTVEDEVIEDQSYIS